MNRPEKKMCYACNGSGFYDNTGSPKCGSCNGKGYEKPSKHDWKEYANQLEKQNKEAVEIIKELKYYASYCPDDEKKEMLRIINDFLNSIEETK